MEEDADVEPVGSWRTMLESFEVMRQFERVKG